MTPKQSLIKSTHYGKIEVGNIEIPCYILEDGRRVLSGRGTQTALNLGQTRGQKVVQLVSNKDLLPLVSDELKLGIFNPIEFKGNTGFKTYGYEASVLIDICDLVLQARQNKVLPDRYNDVAIQAEILTCSFAKVGLIALIDEVTGYQYDRERNELQKILKAYIAEELFSWQKRFPDIYYRELFRLNGWNFTIKGIKKRPGVIGKWTNTLIYEQLPSGVIERLKEITPKSKKGNYSARFHQSLTIDIGEPNLTNQINQVVTLFQLSDNMQHMWQLFERLKSRQQGQLELPFEFDENGRTIEPSITKGDLDDAVDDIFSADSIE